MKELISKWQALTHEVKCKTTELEEARKLLNELDAEHTNKVNEWSIEKEEINNTIAVLTEEIKDKEKELKRIETDSTELRRKIDERKLRNKNHLEILEQRRSAVESNIKKADERDASIKERLELFRISRQELREQLISSIAKLENTLPQEVASHDQQVSLLSSKIVEVEAMISSQAQEWALESAIEKWNRTVAARTLLLSDISSAEQGKDMWAGIINNIEEISADDTLNQVQKMLMRIKM